MILTLLLQIPFFLLLLTLLLLVILVPAHDPGAEAVSSGKLSGPAVRAMPSFVDVPRTHGRSTRASRSGHRVQLASRNVATIGVWSLMA